MENAIVYKHPDMDKVVVKNVEYPTLDGTSLSMDIYYPPGMERGSRLPVVIFVLGYPDTVAVDKLVGCKLKDWGPYVTWGRLTAASGLVAVTYETEQPDDDLEALVEFLRGNAASLNIDEDRIGIWSCSGNVPAAMSYVMQESREYIKLAVFYYGFMFTPDNKIRAQVDSILDKLGGYSSGLKDVDEVRTDLPIFVVRAGQDDTPSLNESIDHFISAALDGNVPLTLINYAEGPHAFDINHDTGRSREIIGQTIEFMKLNLDA